MRSLFRLGIDCLDPAMARIETLGSRNARMVGELSLLSLSRPSMFPIIHKTSESASLAL